MKRSKAMTFIGEAVAKTIRGKQPVNPNVKRGGGNLICSTKGKFMTRVEDPVMPNQ